MSKMSENSILERIHHYFPNSSKALILGRGDDCAVLSLEEMQNKKLVVTTDIFTEDVHFRRSYFSPEAIGYKSLAVNISDIYAMGAQVLCAQLALSLPRNIDSEYLDSLLASLAKLAKEHDFTFSGGDLSKDEKLSLSITLLGLVDKEVNLYRNNAEQDDVIFLIGNIGLSRLALTLLESENQDEIRKYPQAHKQHLFPQMHRKESEILCAFAKKHKNKKFSLMDVSDGLAQDLPRLIQDYGYHLTIDEKDLHEELLLYASSNALSIKDIVEFALKGGEDYALLGTCPHILWNDFKELCPQAKKIGLVTEKKEYLLNNERILIQGFDHFNS